jgi:hypothetical protein
MQAQPLNNDGFRKVFPEFGKVETYPDIAVNFWLGLARSQMSIERWGDAYDMGLCLYAAHNLVLSKRNAGVGGPGGGPAGPMTSKSVGGASASYDVSATLTAGAGEWNLTSYGQRWLRLARMAGAGGVQL